jgi:ubiquinol-cytochrome c reductase iron-sulfur subunit
MNNPRWIALAFAVSVLASIGWAAVYIQGGQPQLEGLLLFASLGGIAVGLVLWAKKLMPSGPFTQQRDIVPPQVADREEAEESFELGAERIGRRRFLTRGLLAALAAFGVAAIFPIRSLGSAPGSSLFHTSWRKGRRAVGDDGRPILASALSPDSVLTVYPEGHVDSATAQTLLIRLPEEAFAQFTGRRDWTVDNIVGFSKVCTHAGCPVALFRADSNELYCPCHQSVFEVLKGCQPTAGPATLPLPQLPLGLDPYGYVIAEGDYTVPIGPAFWNRGHG